MFNLVIKDVKVQKKDKSLFLFILLNISNVFIFQKNYGISLFICFISIYLLTVYANAYDFKYNSELMINSMPVNRKIVVSAKYLSVFLFFICASIITIILCSILHIVLPGLVKNMINADAVIIEFFIISIYYSIFFPVYYKFGYMKSRWANFIIMMIIGTFVSIAVQISGGFIKDSIIAVISVLLMLISFFISVRIYSNKEF